MIISKAQIRSLAAEFNTLIAKKESSLKAAIKTFNSWKEIASLLKNLLSFMTRVKTIILNDEKELREMKMKCSEFSKLVQIDTNDPRSEEYAVTFVEIQAIISNTASSLTETLISSIQTNFKKLRQALESNVEGELSEKNKVDLTKKACYNDILECLASGKTMDENEYSKKLDRQLELYKEQKYARVVSDSKKYLNTPLMNRKKKDIQHFASGRDSSVKYRTNRNEQQKRTNLKEQLLIHTDHSSSKNQLKQEGRPARNGERRKAKAFSLTGFEFNSKAFMEALHILAEESKTCSICKEENDSILLKCCGRVCMQCIRERLIENDRSVLVNTFEAERKQDAMCVCPVHKVIIEADLLRKIFSAKELERYSIEALKRERKEKKNKKIKNPILCIDCNKVVNDDTKTVKVCSLHKICSTCFV